MHSRSSLLIPLCALVAALAACSIDVVTFTPVPSTPELCGNGLLEIGESCDDGNSLDGDGCDVNCTATRCGNGVTTTGELCDDGNALDGDGCDSNCTATRCGNGVTTTGEGCDDGNTTSGDACDANCRPTGCGNGVITAGEVCDDGNAANGDGCDANCTVTACGNGIPTTGESCDDGNTANGDGCDANCTVTACGNGIPTTGELCDDGNTTNGDGCDVNCTVTRCGNGILTTGETCDDGNTTNGDGCDSNCTITACGNGIPTTGEACDDGNATNGDGCESNCTQTPASTSYIKASNTGADEYFGYSVALSADGSTLAVGALLENSSATGINGTQADNSAGNAGAVYLFVRSGATWVQQAYVKASNTGVNDQFGHSVALSADGSTLAVGARLEASSATGVNGNQADNSAGNAGAVYLFARTGTTWSQQAYLKASNASASDIFGQSIALSADGSTLAVGTYGEASAATGIGGNQTDNSASNAGAVYVFTRSGTSWAQQAYVKASNTNASDYFGQSVALSGDGSTLAVGAYCEASATTGVNGNQSDNTADDAGAVYVFTRSGTAWTQQAYVKASNTNEGDLFGQSVALSGDGATLAVGAHGESSAATGVNGTQVDNSASYAGAVYVFTRSGTNWSQQSYIKASNTNGSDFFGASLALSGNGSTLAVGAYVEASAATGIDGNQADNSFFQAGAVYVLTRSGTMWSQRSYVKATNTGANDAFGYCVSLSSDGLSLAVGARFEDSAAAGVDGNQTSNAAADSGAVYVYR
jgi:cysteine-rich repeat protein